MSAYSSSSYLEKPLIDETVGMQVYLHEGSVWVQGHWHSEVEVVHAISGIVTLEVDNEILHLNPGESKVIAPGLSHSFIASPKSVRLVLQFRLNTLSKSTYGKQSALFIETYLAQVETNSKVWGKETQDEMKSMLFLIQDNFVENSPYREQKLYNLSYQFMMLMLEKVPKRSRISEDRTSTIRLDKLKDIYDFIEVHYQENINLEDLANHVGYSKHYLPRYFKSVTGQTVMAFLNQYRLNQAKWLLITTDLSMDLVAYQSGFQSTKTFHHLFKAKTNNSPLQYRKKMNEKKEK